MLWIELVSVGLVVIVLAVLLFRFGLHLDLDQFRLRNVPLSALGPALVLAMFSFVGFESATTLGGEAREPLRTIPRAVLQCAILAGIFFISAPTPSVGLSAASKAKSAMPPSPLHLLATRAGVSPLGVGIDSAAMIACLPVCWPHHCGCARAQRMAHRRACFRPSLGAPTGVTEPPACHCLIGRTHVRDDRCAGSARRRRLR